ncbi:MAG: hypothetical protein H0T47_24160 [Planctomycetaceae bacterium]|nr:hypothetical protein [Planctomycetaceae bacterium]
MSVTTRAGVKIVLPRTGAHVFWDAVREVYAADDGVAWRQLAMLALRESLGWPESLIATAFGRRESEVATCLDEMRDDLKARFVRG